MRLPTLISVLPVVGAATLAVNRRQDEQAASNYTVADAVAKSFIIEYAPVSMLVQPKNRDLGT